MGDWVYQGIVTKVYDGDTITVDLDMGMRVWQKAVSVRLAGINAPELTGASKALGVASRDALRGLLPLGTVVTIASHEFEKYGRLLATVTVNGTNVNEWMLLNGHAVLSLA